MVCGRKCQHLDSPSLHIQPCTEAHRWRFICISVGTSFCAASSVLAAVCMKCTEMWSHLRFTLRASANINEQWCSSHMPPGTHCHTSTRSQTKSFAHFKLHTKTIVWLVLSLYAPLFSQQMHTRVVVLFVHLLALITMLHAMDSQIQEHLQPHGKHSTLWVHPDQ